MHMLKTTAHKKGTHDRGPSAKKNLHGVKADEKPSPVRRSRDPAIPGEAPVPGVAKIAAVKSTPGTGLPKAAAAKAAPASLQASAEGIEEFDEAYYTNRYRDVADSITAGVWHNGLMHYAISGRASARVGAPKVDEVWYEKAYPIAV